MLKGVGVSLLRISIPGVFIAVMYIFQYLGLPLAFFELENISQNHIRDGRETVWEVFLYISITFSMLIIGFWWASAIQKKQKQNLEECLNLRKFTAASNVERMYIVLLSVLAIYVLLDYCLIIGLDNIAFLIYSETRPQGTRPIS
jgi:D-alanyl-lipoteichoic acid acyltransferase DltB (MBOAT superfamily)